MIGSVEGRSGSLSRAEAASVVGLAVDLVGASVGSVDVAFGDAYSTLCAYFVVLLVIVLLVKAGSRELFVGPRSRSRLDRSEAKVVGTAGNFVVPQSKATDKVRSEGAHFASLNRAEIAAAVGFVVGRCPPSGLSDSSEGSPLHERFTVNATLAPDAGFLQAEVALVETLRGLVTDEAVRFATTEIAPTVVGMRLRLRTVSCELAP